MNKFLLPSLLLASHSLYAEQITGLVTDHNNQPIAKAKVELHGQHGVYFTDEQGQFRIDTKAVNSPLELHVSAKGYKHVTWHQEQSNQPIQVKLTTTVLEYIDVHGTPLHASMLESASPITVLSDAELKHNHAPTLGETLKSQVGIHSTYFGPSAASPIIRGLDGPRVMIAQNSLEAGDASRVGPDHVVSTDTATVKQVEILRGPATLIFGNGAIGGVVNIVDNRVPTSSEFEADWSLSHNTVADENEGSFNLTTGTDKLAFHIDGFKRDGSDYEIPANPEEGIHEGETEAEHEAHEAEFTGKLDNSSSESKGINLGASYLMDNGYVGISVGKLDKLYGITGHSHAHGHEHEGEHEEEGHEEENHAEGSVMGDMEQDRVQIISEFNLNSTWLSAVKTKYGYTDYQHAEIENGRIGTMFSNESHQFKTDLLLKEMNEWHGALSFDYKSSDFSASGEEAFTPPSETSSFAVALLEEKHFGDVLLQLGGRVESVKLEAKQLFDVEHHHEEEHHDEDDHEEAHHDEVMSYSETFSPISLSAGLVWDFAEGQNVGISISHAERAPTASEVFSYGPHIGTQSFEIGALYNIHKEDEEHFHAHINENELELETSNNIDISYRKFDGDFGIIFNLFYNRIDDFYYQANTGLRQATEHEHHEDEGHANEHAEEHDEHGEEHHDDEHEAHEEGEATGLPVFITQARDAELYGFEAQFIWQLTPSYKLKLQSDYIRGKLIDGGNLPRIPPARLAATLDYLGDNWDGKLEVSHSFKQSDIASYETETDAYTMVNLAASYYFNIGEQDLTAFVKANNLTDEEARVHSSYLKSTTLLPGRGFTVGIRGSF